MYITYQNLGCAAFMLSVAAGTLDCFSKCSINVFQTLYFYEKLFFLALLKGNLVVKSQMLNLVLTKYLFSTDTIKMTDEIHNKKYVQTPVTTDIKSK